jgi:hypothetical protein
VEPEFYLSETHVGAIIECARQIALKFIETETDFDWESTGIEDQLIDLVTSFQQIRDGYQGHNALEDADTWQAFLAGIRKIDVKEF